MEDLEDFFKFTYRQGQPVRRYGKVVLLDKHRKWKGLAEGWDYIIENITAKDFEKCIVITDANFVLVDDITPNYQVVGGPHIDLEKEQIKFNVKRTITHREKEISSEMDYNNFTFGLTGEEEFYDLLPAEAKQQVNDFCVWLTWIRKNQLVVLGGTSDFLVHRGFRLRSDTVSLKVETSGLGEPEQPKHVYVPKMQELVYQPVFQEGFEPAEAQALREVTNRLATLSLDDSGLSFSFRPVWKSPTMMVGTLTINGELIEGLVKRPGDGTGSYLDAVMYLGLMELPPATLSDNDLKWLDAGGRVCWIYEFTRENITGELLSNSMYPPDDANGWVKVTAVCGGNVRYIQDAFNYPGYVKLFEEPLQKFHLEKRRAEEIEVQLRTQRENAQALIAHLPELFKKVLALCSVSYISTLISEIRKDIALLDDDVRDGNTEILRKKVAEIEGKIQRLPGYSLQLEQEEVENANRKRKEIISRASQLGIPEQLLEVFRNDIERASQFMSNVAKVETFRLDPQELSCGRARATKTCEDAWLATGETSDFFCGADTNDVKWYVYAFHFAPESLEPQYEESLVDDFEEEEEENIPQQKESSAQEMADALERLRQSKNFSVKIKK